MLRTSVPAILLFAASLAPHAVAQDAKMGLGTIYNFKADAADAYQSNSPFVINKNGVMIGVSTEGGIANRGAAFTLTPPPFPGDPWAEQVLFSFQGGKEGDSPLGPLVIQGTNLIGVTGGGSPTCGVEANAGCGLAFTLSPPAIHGGSWRQTLIYNFGPNGAGGWGPSSGLVADANGVLYGVAQYGPGAPTKGRCNNGCGLIYSLTPPTAKGSPWTHTVLYKFLGGKDGANPNNQLTIDSGSGVLYGTSQGGDPRCTGGCGTVFSLAPPVAPGAPWTHTVLHIFTQNHPAGGLVPGTVVQGRGGLLYGTTSSGGTMNFGTVYALRPPSAPGSPWQEKLIYSFTNGTDGGSPLAGMTIGASQDLYGTTSRGGDAACAQAAGAGCGTVYQLKPPAAQGSPWTFTALHAFTGANDGGIATPGLAISSKGILYGATSSGGVNGVGTVFAVVP